MKRTAIWLLFSMASAGLGLFVFLCITQGPPTGRDLKFWLWPVGCILVQIPAGLYLFRTRDKSGRPQFYMTDLLLLSLFLATFLSIVRAYWRPYFLAISITGGLVITILALAAFIRASRRGYTRGQMRVSYSAGSFMLFLGIAGVSLLPFCLILLVLYGEWDSLSRFFQQDDIGAIRAFLAGIPLVLIGGATCRIVERDSSKSSNGP